MPVWFSPATRTSPSFRRFAIISEMATDATLVVYTRPDCSYSDALLHDLDKDGVEYKQIDLSMFPELVSEVERLTGGERVTPVMVEGDLVIVGYNGIG
jgi:glutaredoxin